jgi:CRISPR-associated endonuclease Cas1
MPSEKAYVVCGVSSIMVDKGDLVIEDGIPRGTRVRRFPRITDVTRIIIPSRLGFISLEAFGWLFDVGIEIMILRDGDIINTSTYSHINTALRRAQTLVFDQPAGLEITKYILHQKMVGQSLVAAMFDEDVAQQISNLVPEIDRKTSIKACGTLEGATANKYWDSWRNLRVEWSGYVKDHWRGFDGRHSPVTRVASPRVAGTPVNAILNFAYGVLEGRTVMACHTLGLDPYIGISHLDKTQKKSMAHDLMEVGRPIVDGLIVDWIRNRVFKADEFTESGRGQVRVKDALTRHLSAIVLDSVTEYATHWEWVANRLVEASEGGTSRKRTPITRQNNKDWQAK